VGNPGAFVGSVEFCRVPLGISPVTSLHDAPATRACHAPQRT